MPVDMVRARQLTRTFGRRVAVSELSHNLAAGEIVSTGTLTRALPVKPGETWTTKLTGIALEGASLRFE